MRSTAQLVKQLAQASREMATRSGKERKVAVLGAAGGIGQPLSLLMKVGPEGSDAIKSWRRPRAGASSLALPARR